MNLFDITGNPFIDAGIYVLLNLTKKNDLKDLNKSDLKNSSETLVKILSDDSWRGSLTQILPNSKIANFSIKDRRGAYSKFLENLINDCSAPTPTKSCWGCNNRKGSFSSSRAEFPLTGSLKMVNFYPNWDNGIKICGSCLFSVQFATLVMSRCVDELVLLHSDSDLVMKAWTEEVMKSIRLQLSNNSFQGINYFGYKNGTNFIFYIASRIINEYDENWSEENPFIRLYFFTNFLQSPKVKFIDIPHPIFRFLAYIKQAGLNGEWQKFVHGKTKRFSRDKDKAPDEIIKIRPNPIYQRLIQEKTILYYFLDRKNHKNNVSWQLFQLYAEVVLKLKIETLEYIKNIGNLIVELMKKKESKKLLFQIEKCRNSEQLRKILIKLEKESLIYFNEPLFKVDDVATYLFPESEPYGWKEARDFLLFSIYEHGFKFFKQFVDEIKDEIIDEDEDEKEEW